MESFHLQVGNKWKKKKQGKLTETFHWLNYVPKEFICWSPFWFFWQAAYLNVFEILKFLAYGSISDNNHK